MNVKVFIHYILFAVLLMSVSNAKAQTIKGIVIDQITKHPIENVEIHLVGYKEKIVISDEKGYYILQEVPLGRHIIFAYSIGYEVSIAQDILVTNGKEAVFNIELVEAYTRVLDSVTIYSDNKLTPANEMHTVSKISFRQENTKKFAGTFGDPARMLVNFAGMASASDSKNDIIVRGNSPNGILWRMEGLEILNPNHFGEITNTGGPVSLINSNNLGTSDFYSGAFPAQFGNALSGVFDLSLRNGNASQTEMVAQIGFSGVEFGVEGSLSSKYNASYIVNYRYSTLGILKKVGLDFGTGSAIPQYQDLSFKVQADLTPKTKMAVWGMGGPSKINFIVSEDQLNSPTATIFDNLRSSFFTGMGGISTETNYNKKTNSRIQFGIGYGNENAKEDSIGISINEVFPYMETCRSTTRWTGAYDLTHKFNAKNHIVTGISVVSTRYDLYQMRFSQNGLVKNALFNQQNTLTLLKGYAQWKHRFTEKFSANTGIHLQGLTLNNTFSIEPRIGLIYKFSSQNTFSFGYGLHGQAQNALVYFYPTTTGNGNFLYSNKNLDFTKSHHFVLALNSWLTSNLQLKSELYYQSIFNAPVERTSSTFSALNVGGIYSFPLKEQLVNNGSGRNYGLEITLQKHFSDDYYLMGNGSIFSSRYKGSDNIERNTPFNSSYAFKIVAGKELHLLDGKLSLNLGITSAGGRFTTPVDLEKSKENGYVVYDETIAPFSIRQRPYFRADIKIGYSVNLKKSTVEYGMDIRNVSNHSNLFLERYNRRTDQLVNEYQQGFLIIPYFRWTF